MTILVTGYSGFIGSYLINQLNKLKFNLILCDLANGIDICNWEQVKEFNKIDIIIHLANLSYVPASYQEPKKFYEVNYIGTLNILELCRINGARMIYFSSYMYGNPQYQPIDENHPVQAYNPYSQTKVICENLCEGYNRDFNVPITIFRPFNIYGKGQNPDFLIPTIISQAKTGKIVIKDDRPKRDFIHVNDVVEAVLSSIQFENNAFSLQKYNLGTGKSFSVREIVDFVCMLSNYKVDYYCSKEIRQNEVLDTIANISKIKENLGWEPKITLLDGLKSMLE
jgi:nucleoside-diphosphate-sugar epimerase